MAHGPYRPEIRPIGPVFDRRRGWFAPHGALLCDSRGPTVKQVPVAAELPAAFITTHGAVVVENHLNMIKPLNGTPKVRPAVLAALLNSDLVDQVFRCINGSVAVSAYELEALPLPSPETLQELDRLVRRRATRDRLEHAVERLYGSEDH